MAASAAEYYEVRWRLKDSDEAWSLPRRVAPVGEIVVEELGERAKDYEFEVRAVSNCGAASVWVSGTHTVPDAPAGTLTLAELRDDMSDAADEAAEAIAALEDIASDNVLSAGEKPTVIRDYSVITDEQAGIDAQATAYGITTTKTAYDTAVTALTTYLGTLTSPVAWNSLTGNTAIVGTTFRSKFADVYTKRQALLNAIYAAAKAKADAAQSTADKAQALASSVAVINAGFDAGATGWTMTSGWSIKSDGSFGYGPGYAEKSGGGSSASLRNNAVCFVEQGKSYRVQALIKAIGANGQCYARISWRDLNDSEISVTNGNLVSGTTVAGSFAVGTPPSGAVFAHAEIAATSHTTGTYQVDNVVSTLQPATADEIAESGSRKWAAESGADKTDNNSNFKLVKQQSENGSNLARKGMWIDGELGSWFSPDARVFVGHVSSQSVNQGLYLGDSNASGVGSINAYEPDNFVPVQDDDILEFIARGVCRNGYSSLQFGIYEYDAGKNFLRGNRAIDTITPGGYKTIRGRVKVSSDAVYAHPVITASGTSDGSSVSPTALYYLIQRADGTQVAGSGARLGGTPNMPAVSVLNYGSSWDGLSITYTATTTSFTVTVSSATLLSGGKTINYSSSSLTRAGTAGATYRENLYYNDPGFAGGSRTLNASIDFNNVISNDGNVFLGAIMIHMPTSGSSSGGGSSDSSNRCPDVGAWVLRADPDGKRADWVVRAGDAAVGDYLRLTHGGVGLVTYSERKASPRVRVAGHRGKGLTCSPSAPLEEPAGTHVLAADAAGHDVRVLSHMAALADRIERVDVLRAGYVQHITCEDADFWAGDDPDCLFAHHNLKPIGDL